jgi:membrane-associated phospholipid phosphatase
MAGFAAVYVVTVRTPPGRLAGDRALRGAMLAPSVVAGQVTRVLDVVSVATLAGATAVIAVIALVRLRRTAGLAAIGVLVGANLTTQLLKVVLPRPDLGLAEVTPATLNSMPSGHTTAVLSAAVGVLFVVPARWRTLLAVCATGYVSLTAVATMTAGWHRAGDSLAAFFVVGAWAAAGVAVVVAVDGPSTATESTDRPDHADLWWWLAAAALLAGAAAIIVTSGLDAGLRTSLLGAVMTFTAAVMLIVAAATAVTRIAVVLLRLNDPGILPARSERDPAIDT